MRAGFDVAGLDRRNESESDPVEDRGDEAILDRLVAAPGALERVGNLGPELAHRERLDQHSGRTIAERPDRIVERRMTGGDDDRNMWVALADGGQEVVPVHAGHPDVGDDQVVALRLEELQGPLRAVGRLDDEVHPFEEARHQAEGRGVIVDAEGSQRLVVAASVVDHRDGT